MTVCVAVVGHQNNPLYIQSFTEADDALKLYHTVHCSLDVVDERVNNPKKSGPTLNETFLGLFYPTKNYGVYGYLTNTKVKFILVTTDLDVRDANVRNELWPIKVPNESCSENLKNNLLLAAATGIIRFSSSDSNSMRLNHFFREFHTAYVDAVSNPFHVPGKKITSRTFAERDIVESFGSSSAG